jgi:hypothetical protein
VRSLAAFAVVVALAGCADDGDEGAAGAVDCGSYERLNAPVTAEQREQNACFLEALRAGRPATLRVTLATVEGDPVPATLRVVGVDRLEYVHDARQDRYGSGEVETFVCTGLDDRDGQLVPTGCEPA